ncbi:unnamed protein product [Macrosiphum euphorbiae]|uniref:PiggyBac transposable element-derived protein domain-containing protein n=1 Tax=Macrosiphum euphorbiae TaxID=13131 RepID=A0AAV0XUW3_9HEMI|nr:unnamed protein product [Macrosiphum euphorbiae]CAI6374792.1 unnamed protein product [Macrosiphum euphorbiae]
MNSKSISEMLESSFDYSSVDDSDDDPSWDKNVEVMSTSTTSSIQNNGRHVNIVASDVELSGVSEINSDGNDPDFDMVSHISASTDGDFAPTARGQGCPSIHTNDRQWRDDDNVVDDFMFNPDITNSGINPDLFDVLMHGSPLDFYMLIVDSKIINNIVIETNKFAAQQKEAKLTSPFARLNKWYDTNVTEMKQLFGILIWTGLVVLPSYELYWSTSEIFSTNFGLIMSRNRFEILMGMLHFSDNTTADTTNRLYKLGTVIDDIIINSNHCMQPLKDLCIDESLVKFMGRLAFKQYIKNKRDRFGVKEFKLCIPPCYTIALKIYAGKEASPESSVGTKIVMELGEPFLDCGRTLYVDNWYSSVELAEQLKTRKTHLVGTIRSNRKSNPKDVVQKKLKKGEIVSKRSDTNVLILKWKDKRDLYMISTKHTSEAVENVVRGKIVKKPKVVIDYNTGKTAIDLSDQMSSYSNPLRRTTKWYRKVALDALLNIAVVNSMVLFNTITSSKMSITDFRTSLVEQLLKKETVDVDSSLQTINHQLEVVGKSRCYVCYSIMSKRKGRNYAQSHSTKVQTKCLVCNKYYCLKCFFKNHKITK